MIRFTDGPAIGVCLRLRRAPLYLRVARSRVARDALDQLDDEPKPRERITVYVRVTLGHRTHIKSTRSGASGWYANASYRMVADQPGDEVVRGTEKWREWCYARQKVDFPKVQG